MSWKEMMQHKLGYTTITTYWDDFSLAETMPSMVEYLFSEIFPVAKTNVKFITELSLVLNHKIWAYYEINPSFAQLYDKLWRKCDNWCYDNLKGDDLHYYFRTTD